MFITKLPSPSMSTTRVSGQAAWAPIAAGRPKPIEPRPPEVIQVRGLVNLVHCAAHIWCWPTPVVMMNSPLVSFENWSMTYCGRIASSRWS